MPDRLIAILLWTLLPTSAFTQQHWIEVQSPTTKDLQRIFFLDSLRGWIAGNEGTILHTFDGGITWTPQDAVIRTDIVDIFFLDSAHGWALSHEFSSGYYGSVLLGTTDGGASWTNRRYTEEEVFLNSVKFLDLQTGWMAGEFGVLVGTTNGGVDWQQANLDSTLHLLWDLSNLSFYSPHYGYAMGGRFDITGVIWRTTNGGISWNVQTAGPEPVYDIHFFDSLHVMGIGGDYDFGSGKLVTTNGGETWEYTYLDIWGQARAIGFRTPTEAWAPLGFAGTYMYSLDAGETWTDLPVPNNRPMNDLIFLDSTRGYMVGNRGTILKFNTPPVSVQPEMTVSSPTAMLHPAYPNPFNSSTTIGYTLGTASTVALAIHDIRGRHVRTLVHQYMDSGNHSVIFTAHNLASGVYVCRLEITSDGRRKVISRLITLLR